MSDSNPHAHEHHRFQAHHFDTTEQQFQAGKLGMWLFLATEVLFFSGMFCAYTVYRVNHPDVFEDAHHHLNPMLGAANTIVLLASSLSVAWAVRCAQLNKQGGLLANLIFTLVCAGIFMGVKTVEYTLKAYEGLLWRAAYSFEKDSHPDLSTAHEQLHEFGLLALVVGAAIVVLGLLVEVGLRKLRPLLLVVGPLAILGGIVCFVRANVVDDLSETSFSQLVTYGSLATAIGVGSLITGSILLGNNNRGARWAFFALGATVLGIGGGCLIANVYTLHEETKQHHSGEVAATGGDAHADSHEETHADAHEETHADAHTEGESDTPAPEAAETASPLAAGEFTEKEPPFGGEGPKFPGIFFSIYYAMTGVHAVHILAGIGVFIWIVYRAASWHFEPTYYGPVEYVGLYWHLVDLIWIYLFPLLYLIKT